MVGCWGTTSPLLSNRSARAGRVPMGTSPACSNNLAGNDEADKNWGSKRASTTKLSPARVGGNSPRSARNALNCGWSRCRFSSREKGLNFGPPPRPGASTLNRSRSPLMKSGRAARLASALMPPPADQSRGHPARRPHLRGSATPLLGVTPLSEVRSSRLCDLSQPTVQCRGGSTPRCRRRIRSSRAERGASPPTRCTAARTSASEGSRPLRALERRTRELSAYSCQTPTSHSSIRPGGLQPRDPVLAQRPPTGVCGPRTKEVPKTHGAQTDAPRLDPATPDDS